MRIYCFNVIRPLAKGERKHTVALYLALGETKEEARLRVARDCKPDDLVGYRNDFEPDEVVIWTYQMWGKADVPSAKAVRAADILANQGAQQP